MSRVESGKRRLRADEAERIASKLNLSMTEIIDPIAEPARKECCKRATLPLPEGLALVEYPATLSPQSREELKHWLEFMATVATR
jgi:hypothetical protein